MWTLSKRAAPHLRCAAIAQSRSGPLRRARSILPAAVPQFLNTWRSLGSFYLPLIKFQLFRHSPRPIRSILSAATKTGPLGSLKSSIHSLVPKDSESASTHSPLHNESIHVEFRPPGVEQHPTSSSASKSPQKHCTAARPGAGEAADMQEAPPIYTARESPLRSYADTRPMSAQLENFRCTTVSLALRTIYATLSGLSHARKPPPHSYADQPPFLRSYTNQPRPFLRNRQLPLRIHAPLTRTRRTQLLPPAHSRALHPDPMPHSYFLRAPHASFHTRHPDPPGRHHVGMAICACLLASSRDTTIDDATRRPVHHSSRAVDSDLDLQTERIQRVVAKPFRVWTTETSAVTTHTKVKTPKYSSKDSFVFPHAVAEYKKLDDDEGKVLNQGRMYLASLLAFHSIAIYDREIPMQHYGSAA
ncbi:hypothetical protein C8J57DRAFT_1247141 [Mycena rebaudengoi]|nr:hypothetical protein C8J57DRAFT_1247141 [Mycena rebaudengoi]